MRTFTAIAKCMRFFTSKNLLLSAWSLAFGYYLGQLLWFVLPLPHPYLVPTSYIVALIVGVGLAFAVIKIKSDKHKVMVALAILIIVAATSIITVDLIRKSAIEHFSEMEQSGQLN